MIQPVGLTDRNAVKMTTTALSWYVSLRTSRQRADEGLVNRVIWSCQMTCSPCQWLSVVRSLCCCSQKQTFSRRCVN